MRIIIIMITITIIMKTIVIIIIIIITKTKILFSTDPTNVVFDLLLVFLHIWIWFSVLTFLTAKTKKAKMI